MRRMCYRCFWPERLCWCPSLRPMSTGTRFVFLMHPKEYKEEKAGTGRLTHLCLPNSELHMGTGFDGHERVQELLADPGNLCLLLYPGANAHNLSEGGLTPADVGGRRLVVFLLDATWPLARKMLRLSPTLQALRRVMFTPSAPSRYVIKQQPQPGCLSTLEAVHELLRALEQSGLDRYEMPEQLLAIFARMQKFQIECASDPDRPGYRRRAYSDPSARRLSRGESGRRRDNFLKRPADAPVNPASPPPG